MVDTSGHPLIITHLYAKFTLAGLSKHTNLKESGKNSFIEHSFADRLKLGTLGAHAEYKGLVRLR